jgi:hypothetical protein
MIASDARRSASARDRLALWLHLAMCRYCRAYERSLRAIGDAARRLYETATPDAERAEATLDAVRQAIPQPPPDRPL